MTEEITDHPSTTSEAVQTTDGDAVPFGVEGSEHAVSSATSDAPSDVVSDAPSADAKTRFSRQQSRRKRSRMRSFGEWAIVLAAAFVIAIGLRTFAFQVFFVPSTSMVPSLLVGDRILVDKFLFDSNKLKRGDVIVFARQAADTMCGADETDLVKRVIGLPGQTISEVNGQVLINGAVIKEPYLPTDDPMGSAKIVTETIPPGQFYVLGDNRDVSCDSRYWGTVSGTTIVGKVVAVIWRNNHPYLHIF